LGLNVEVEIKYDVPDASEMHSALERLGRLFKTDRQVDAYYNPPHKNFYALARPVEYLRVREYGDKASFDYKFVYHENGRRTHSDEYETVVGSPEKLKKILSLLGFKELCIVDKKRSMFDCGDFHVCLDEIAELGAFIEVESQKDFGGVSATRSAIEKFVEEKRLPIGGMSERAGYPDMILAKKGLFKIPGDGKKV